MSNIGFLNGSDTEAAAIVLQQFESDGQLPVYAHGNFYQYRPKSGLWEKLERAKIERSVQKLDGSPLQGDDKKKFVANYSRVRGALSCAASLAAKEDFFDLAKTGIAFTNGFVIVTGKGAELFPHSPENRACAGLPFDYSTNSSALHWSKALTEWFKPDPDAIEKIDLLQEFVGACLVGCAASYQKALVLFGDGADGKSKFLDVVGSLFPSEMRTSIAPQEMHQEYRRALLAKSRINCVSELPSGDVVGSDSFKAIISGDSVSAREIREAPFMFRPTAGHIFAGNRLPGTADQSTGYWRRMMPVTFNRRFKEYEQDIHVAERIIEKELPAVAAWAIEGAVRLLKRGRYAVPKSSTEVLEEWSLGTDAVRQFVEEQLEVMPENSENEKWTSTTTLYCNFSRFAQDYGYKTMNINTFSSRLARIQKLEKKRTGSGIIWNVKKKPETLHWVVGPRTPLNLVRSS